MRKAQVSTPEKERKWYPRFLKALGDTGIVSAACQAAGIERTTAYKRRDVDSDFAAAWAEAERLGIEVLEDIATRRALNASDTLLIFKLKGAKPEKYRDNQRIEHTGQIGMVQIREVVVERPQDTRTDA